MSAVRIVHRKMAIARLSVIAAKLLLCMMIRKQSAAFYRCTECCPAMRFHDW
jgi:hypothetical protein